MYLVIFKPSRYEVRGLSYFYLSEFGLTQSGLKTTKNNSRTWIVGKADCTDKLHLFIIMIQTWFLKGGKWWMFCTFK